MIVVDAPDDHSLMRESVCLGMMARLSTGALLLLAISAVAKFSRSEARDLGDYQVHGRSALSCILMAEASLVQHGQLDQVVRSAGHRASEGTEAVYSVWSKHWRSRQGQWCRVERPKLTGL